MADAVGDTLRTMYGYPPRMSTQAHQLVRIGDTLFRDSYRADVDGRGVVVTNAWKNIQGEINGAADELRGVAVCVVELPTMLPIACIQPRRFKQVAVGPVVTTGDRAFDDAYLVTGQPPLESTSVLTPAVTQHIATRDDWVFRAHRAWLACVSLGPFRSADEMVQRIDQVLGIVAAFPASVVPTAIDHSADDLIERAAKLQTFDEALVFLQGLTDAERARLRSSDSPLAVMADVRTPAEAMERFKSLDQEQKLQLYALVQRVKR
jgi:hypothetical protein